MFGEFRTSAAQARQPLTLRLPIPGPPSWAGAGRAVEAYGQTVLEVPANYADDATHNPIHSPTEHDRGWPSPS